MYMTIGVFCLRSVMAFINALIARYYYAAFDGEVPIAVDLREEGGGYDSVLFTLG